MLHHRFATAAEPLSFLVTLRNESKLAPPRRESGDASPHAKKKRPPALRLAVLALPRTTLGLNSAGGPVAPQAYGAPAAPQAIFVCGAGSLMQRLRPSMKSSSIRYVIPSP